jgi:Tfp pilus assembly protein PilZ
MRKFVRNSTDVPIDLEVQSIEPKVISDCKMTSISFGGLSCEIDDKLMVGSKLNVSIPSVSPPYHGDGDVVWCKPTEVGYEIGVRFTHFDETTTSRMVQQVCQIEHYKNIVFDREGKLLDGKQAAEQWMDKHGT